MLCIPPAIPPKVEGLCWLRWSSLSTPPAAASLLGVGGQWSSHSSHLGCQRGQSPARTVPRHQLRMGSFREAWIARRCTPSHFSLFCSLLGNLAVLVLLYFWQFCLLLLFLKSPSWQITCSFYLWTLSAIRVQPWFSNLKIV